ncbi:MAG: NAD-dependent deacylase [Rhodothermales bacterium]|nr:NAD-dependent deacylase [Rhodothermales bacterium]
MPSSALDRLKTLVEGARSAVAFTGAGISADSGIPTYRGNDGLWTKYDPAKYADINYFRRDPEYYWRFFQEVRYHVLSRAQPNEGHLALSTMEQRGKLTALITQNIDGLHQRAGSQRVIELHGNSRRFPCVDCGTVDTLEEVFARLDVEFPPCCTSCGGSLRPGVVFFGEMLPPGAMEESTEAASACDLFLAIGSSLVVTPASSLPVIAKEHGARLVLINNEPTALDGMADLVMREGASEVLSAMRLAQ